MKFTLFIDRERCKGCLLCINACAKAVLKLSKKLNSRGYHYPETDKPEACVGCRNCALMCPDTAIEIEAEETPAKPETKEAASKSTERKKH